MPPEAAGLAFLGELRALRERYARELPAKLEALEAAWSALQDAWSDEALHAFHRQAHSLAGSGATYGFAELSRSARLLEYSLKSLIDDRRVPSPEGRTQIATLVEQVRAAADRREQTAAPPTPVDGASAATAAPRRVDAGPSPEPQRHIIILDGVSSLLPQDLAAQLGCFGYRVSTCDGDAALVELLKQGTPAAIVIDSASARARAGAGEARLERIAPDSIPIVCISEHGDLMSRLQAVRAGADAYFTSPVDVTALIDKIEALTTSQVSERYRVLIVDDDPSLAAMYELSLRQAGMATVVVSHPLQIMQPLHEFGPDLILMDMYMPDCSGLELAKVIRQQDAFVSVPIVFLSGETNLEKQLAAMYLGGDDFLTKPIEPDHLISSVASRIERTRILRSYMIRDSLTGLLNHSTVMERLSLEIARAARFKTPLAVAMLDIDHFKSVNDSYGHVAGDRVIKSLARLLQQRLRKTDSVGRYGGEEFMVILPECDGAAAVRILDDLRLRFAQIRQHTDEHEFSATFSCGVAALQHGYDMFQLRQASDEALYRAKALGRNRVVLAGSGPAPDLPGPTGS